MIVKMFTVYDSKAEIFLPPFFLGQEGQATRAFADCVNAKNHPFGKHPQDYTLFRLGEYDDATGLVTTLLKVSLGNGIEFLKLELGVPGDDDLDADYQNREFSDVTPIHADSPVLANEARRNSKVKL